jgi:hypothetical protein
MLVLRRQHAGRYTVSVRGTTYAVWQSGPLCWCYGVEGDRVGVDARSTLREVREALTLLAQQK